MTEKTRVAVHGYATLDVLIDSVCQGVGIMRSGELGTWQAERLERAAKVIREKCSTILDSPS